MSSKKVFLTGSRGYIGTNVSNFLERKGLKVLHCDLPDCDIVNLNHLPEIPDAIVHLAAVTGVEKCKKDPVYCFTVNVIGSYNVITLALTNKIPIIIISSQAAKYTNASYYGFTKRCAERYALQLFNFGLKGVILRPSNVYGGSLFLEKKDTVIARFIKRYKEGKPLIIYGDGRQHRNFLHVEDLCKAIWMCLMKFEERDYIQDILDIVSLDTLTINDVADLFENAKKVYDKNGYVGSRDVNFNAIKTLYKIEYKPRMYLQEWIGKQIR